MSLMHKGYQLFFLRFGISLMIPDIIIDIDFEFRMTILEFYRKFLDYFNYEIDIDCIDKIVDRSSFICRSAKI